MLHTSIFRGGYDRLPDKQRYGYLTGRWSNSRAGAAICAVTRSFPLAFRTSASPISSTNIFTGPRATGQEIRAIRYSTLAITLTLEVSELFRICT